MKKIELGREPSPGLYFLSLGLGRRMSTMARMMPKVRMGSWELSMNEMMLRAPASSIGKAVVRGKMTKAVAVRA